MVNPHIPLNLFDSHIKQIVKELAKFDFVELSKKDWDLSYYFIPFYTHLNSNILEDDNAGDASFASYDHLIEEVKFIIDSFVDCNFSHIRRQEDYVAHK